MNGTAVRPAMKEAQGMATRVAVTGAAGRVGQGVLDLFLSRGNAVVAIDSLAAQEERLDENVTWVQADVTDYSAIVKALDGCDGLVHLAAIARPGLVEDSVVHANNVVGSYNALRAAAEVGITRVCQASSVNAIGCAWSRSPRFDYFPLDEEHPGYAEDPYSLSKWICEQQAEAVARRYPEMSISSFRYHMVVPERARATAIYAEAPVEVAVKNLWGYTSLAGAAGACWLGLDSKVIGHEAFHIVAPDHVGGASSTELAEQYYAGVPRPRALRDDESFFDCTKAARLLGWQHQDW
jgi:nucleoside-diphosphate-sugar epimerase